MKIGCQRNSSTSRADSQTQRFRVLVFSAFLCYDYGSELGKQEGVEKNA